MQCQRCHGTGDDPELRDPENNQILPCRDCGGDGVAHCCEGDQAQPDLDLGPCCMCEGPGARNLIMLSRRGAIPGHGWGCVVCDLPMDGAYAVLCEACIIRWQQDESLLKVACRGWPGEGRIPITELPKGVFDHDMRRHRADVQRGTRYP